MIAPIPTAFHVLLFTGACAAAFASGRPRFSSFAGVNFPSLPFLGEAARDAAIREVVRGGASVIRLTIRGDENFSDPEAPLGEFNRHTLDVFDDAIAAVHRISRGKTKVIIAPHDVDALRARRDATDPPCDSYCDKADGAWVSFYVRQDFRDLYKRRLEFFFTRYKSKNFGGAPWNTLGDVILGVDLQNEPFSGIWPIPVGHNWPCDIATHLKDTLELGKNGIAVISGGVSGLNSKSGWENWPSVVFDCEAVDVIGIHGSFSATNESTAGAHWMKMLLPGGRLLSRALDNKLVLVEDVHSSIKGKDKHQAAVDLWDQGDALNHRGIPWLASMIVPGTGSTEGMIGIAGRKGSAKEALWNVMRKSNDASTIFDWSKFTLQSSPRPAKSEVTPNPYRVTEGGHTFGQLGWVCNAMDDCRVGLVCKNSVCQKCEKGCPGMRCDALARCQEWSECVGGVCQAYESRSDASCLPPTSSGGRKGAAGGFCETKICNFCDRHTCRGSPCANASDCGWEEVCDWGVCKPCTAGCLGDVCKNSMDCKTGACSGFKRCDYPPPNTGPLAPPVQRTGKKGKRGQGGDFGAHPVILGNPRDLTRTFEQAKATAT